MSNTCGCTGTRRTFEAYGHDYCAYCQKQIGSGTQSLSDSEPVSAQERERNDRTLKVVPSLPSADIRLVGSLSFGHIEEIILNTPTVMCCGVGPRLKRKIIQRVREKIGSVASSADADRERKDPMAADGSIAQARSKLIAVFNRWYEAKRTDDAESAINLFEVYIHEAIDALILLCQSEAQQEMSQLQEENQRLTRERDAWKTKAEYNAPIGIEGFYLRRAEAAESLAAERQQEIAQHVERGIELQRVADARMKDYLEVLKRAEAAESSLSLLQEQRTTHIQEQKEHLGGHVSHGGRDDLGPADRPELRADGE